MRKLVWQNANGEEINLTSGDFGITNWEGFSNAPLNIQSQQVPFQDGSVFLDALIENRELNVTLAIQDGNDLEKRYQYQRQLNHALNPKFGEGYLIYTNDYISKRIKCIPQIPLFPNKNSNEPGTQKASLSWTACEPYWEDLEEKDILIIGGKRFHITNEGDIPIGVRMTLAISDVTNPLISNITENKKINLNGRFYNNIQINTQMGEKNISKQNLIFDTITNDNKEIFSVTYSKKLGLFVAVGASGISLSSPDGETWSYKQIATQNLRGITYSEKLGLFVAVGQFCVGRSTDGINWTFDSQARLRGVIYSEELELFIAVGEQGVIITSPDGVTWTLQTSGTNAKLMDVCYSENKNLLVAVGNGVVLTSSDGVTWTNQSANVSYLMSVTYSEAKNLFVAVGSDNYIYTSSDGVTWTVRTSIANIILYSVTYSEEHNLFVVVGDNGTIRTSTDGINWVNQTSGVTDNFQIVFYSEDFSLFITAGTNGRLETSTNAINWAEKLGATNDLNSVTYSEEHNLFVVVGDNGTIRTSTDGINWVNQTSGVTDNLLYVTYVKEKRIFVSVGENGVLLKSENGETWTSRTISNVTLTSIIYVEELGKYIVVGFNGQIRASNNDGENWYTVTSGVSKNLYSIAYGKNKGFVVGGADGTRLFSVNGISWTNYPSVFYVHIISGVTYSDDLGLFVAVENNGGIMWSKDGYNWHKSAYNKQGHYYPKFQSVIYVKEKGLFVTTGENSNHQIRIVISADGDNWNELNGVNFVSNSISYSPKLDKFIIVGEGGVILNSSYSDTDNLISNLTPDSDMTLGLDVGDNTFLISEAEGIFNCQIKYRQKYIGV